jgi:hypothetical protein
LEISDGAVAQLADRRQIAIHFARDRFETGDRYRNSESLDPDDYQGEAKTSMRVMVELARDGGYVCAAYRGHPGLLVGKVLPGTEIQINKEYRWQRAHHPIAALKTLPLDQDTAGWIAPPHNISLEVCRPQRGTMRRWHLIRDRIRNLVEGESPESMVRGATVQDLGASEIEVMCAEYLRIHECPGTPTMEIALLPVGRTLRDIDLYGLTPDGRALVAQVTMSKSPRVLASKLQALEAAAGGAERGAASLFFCPFEARPEVSASPRTQVLALEHVFKEMCCHEPFRQWLRVHLAIPVTR